MGIIFSDKGLSTDRIACGGRFNIILTLSAEPNFIDDPENPGTEIPVPGAENIVVTDTVSPGFRVIGLSSPSKGTATLNNSNNVVWTIDALAETEQESAILEFTVQHIGPCSGTVEVNESISYDDATGNVVTFPSPTIEVDCGVNYCEGRCADIAVLDYADEGYDMTDKAGNRAMSEKGYRCVLAVADGEIVYKD